MTQQLMQHAPRTAGEPSDGGETLELLVNGEPRSAPAGTKLGAYLRSLELDPQMVVVERNRVILHDRTSYDAVPLERGDVLEIVHFVGGG
jgi:sulfur carrier protein